MGTPGDPKQAFLTVDQEILFEVDVKDCVLAITGVFYVFNICYTKGLGYVFSCLETVLLNVTTKLSPTVSNFISVIS